MDEEVGHWPCLALIPWSGPVSVPRSVNPSILILSGLLSGLKTGIHMQVAQMLPLPLNTDM